MSEDIIDKYVNMTDNYDEPSCKIVLDIDELDRQKELLKEKFKEALSFSKFFLIIITEGMIYVTTIAPDKAVSLLNRYATNLVSYAVNKGGNIEAGTGIVFFYKAGKLIPVRHLTKYDDIIKFFDDPVSIAKFAQTLAGLGTEVSEFSVTSFILGLLIGILGTLIFFLRFIAL